MPAALPAMMVPVRPAAWIAPDINTWPWKELPALTLLTPAAGTGMARYPTATRICADTAGLYVHFDCHDRDIWGTLTSRDAAIYDEEVVEVFIAPGEAVPATYYEFEVSPLGTLLDLVAHNPTGDRRDMRTDFAWDCPGIAWSAQRFDDDQRWTATFSLPWRSIGAGEGPLPRIWRANFYRIERPHGEEPEFTCWSPTWSDPADYHRPAYFGYLELPDALLAQP
jgi:hypothetical protein